MKDHDDLSWYARKADASRGAAVPPAVEDPASRERIERLLTELAGQGILGSLEDRTLYTRRLPPGCRGCLLGRGTNLFVTGLCTRECFFCFNAKPRTDELVVHGIPVKTPEEAAAVVERYRLRSVGLSGGEPLLKPERVLAVLAALRRLPERVRIDLYTNGDPLDEALAERLRAAGLDSLRFNLVANGFDLRPVRVALARFPETTVEVPVVPGKMADLRRMVLELDALGVPYLNIHELFACGENAEGVRGEGHAAAGERSPHLLWRPVAGGEEAALELLLFALTHARRLSAYYCSCRTQELISARGLARRRRLSL
ncbi:MAG: radical SAM protein [Elusimicrobiota bacterium]|jgi:hypothetical protein